MQPYTRSTARSPSTTPSRSNPERTNNPRDDDRSSTYHAYDRAGSEGQARRSSSSHERAKQTDKIIQVTQNLFKRTALIIVSSRVNLRPILDPGSKTPRSSQWFQLLMNESEELNDKIEEWRYADVTAERPRPLVIEIYLDVGELTRNQTLAVVDERGRKWDVCEALQNPKASSATRGRERDMQIVLERWTIYLDHPPADTSIEATELMANVYKKASITMHSLLAYSNLLPAFKFARRTMQEPATLTALRPLFRIVDSKQSQDSRDTLTTSLYPSGEPTCEKYKFWPLQTPAGQFRVQVAYRKNCNFQVSNYEELVSAHFIGMDEPFDQTTGSETPGREIPYLAAGKEAGSLPADRQWNRNAREANQAYGSLSTFHHAGHTGTSPISALRAARDRNMQSPTGESFPQKQPPDHRRSTSSKSSLKSNEAPPPNVRRQSVSFQPFKAGSLSSSPAQGGLAGPSPSSSYTRSSDISKGLAQARNIRQPPQIVPEVAVGSPTSGSPKAPPMTRYSSSFGHRRSRFSSGGTSASKEDDNNSSGSSSKRGSATLTAPEASGGSGSSGSVHTDDDNIGDFLKMLEQKKDLKSFHRMDDAAKDASGRRTASALSRYRGMRDTNAQLSESLSSSVMLHRSSGSSSQRLSGVPPTLVGASVSTSSSPGKPISPHTPHTPAIPSRLSEETSARRYRDSPRLRGGDTSSSSSHDDSSETTGINLGSGPIPIPPTSPQAVPHARRSSSAHHGHRPSLTIAPFDPRPSSLPLTSIAMDDHELGLNDLFDAPHEASSKLGDDNDEAISPRTSRTMRDEELRQRPVPAPVKVSSTAGRSNASTTAKAQASPSASRPSLLRNRGSTSTSSSGRGSLTRFSFGNRPGANSTGDDDEPLLFTMSELNRRSLEEMRPSSSAHERGGSRPAPDRARDRQKDKKKERNSGVGEDMGWSG